MPSINCHQLWPIVSILEARLLYYTYYSHNVNTSAGSGFYIYRSSPQLLHTTIVRNTDGDGSGVHVANDTLYYQTVFLTNTIMVSHTVGVIATVGNIVTLEATLWGTGTWANGTDWSIAGAIIIGTRNYWGPPASSDPDAGDYHIRSDSAAIDKGVNAGVNVDIEDEPRPFGKGYDIDADENTPMRVSKEAHSHLVQAGAQLTYTIRITNTGEGDLHATVTDVLPAYVIPSDILTWTPTITAPGGVWVEQVVVGYAGPPTNVVQVTTAEGVTSAYTEVSRARFTPSNQAPNTPLFFPP